MKKKYISVLPIYIKDITKNINLKIKDIQNVMIFHNNYNLPKIFAELSQAEKDNVKLIKRKIKKEFGIRKTKIVKTIKFNEIYIY